MKKKKGVDAKDICPQIWFALGLCEGEMRQLAGVELVITSGRDGEHQKNSLHHVGCAVDIRIRRLTPAGKRRLCQHLKLLLDARGYDVVLESDHLHIEWDPKKGDAPWLQEVA